MGDAYFTKCMRFIKEFKKKGVFYWLVMMRMQLWDYATGRIVKGSIDIYGSPKQVIERYTRDLQVNIEDIARMKEQKQKTVQDNGERNKEEEVEYQLKRRDLEKWSDFRHDAIQKEMKEGLLKVKEIDYGKNTERTYGGERAEIIEVSFDKLEEIYNRNSFKG